MQVENFFTHLATSCVTCNFLHIFNTIYYDIGPSTVRQLLRSFYTSLGTPELLILSSSSSDTDDECEIIGYVKPRHERTPEIIELLSSDTECAVPPTTNATTS